MHVYMRVHIQQLQVVLQLPIMSEIDIQEFLNQLLERLQATLSNAGCPQHLEDPNILVDYHLYFEICQLIFPELSIWLIKIREDTAMSEPEKLQRLIDKLSETLDLDLSQMSGEQILESNLEDIQVMVELLYEYSKMFKENNKKRPGVRSDYDSEPKRGEEIEMQQPQVRGRRGTHEPQKNNDLFPQKPESPPAQEDGSAQEEQYLVPQPENRRKKRPVYSAKAKQARNQRSARKNVHQGVVQTMLEEKGRWLNAAKRVCRKNRLQDVQHQKKAFAIYLNRVTKENVANDNREQHLREKSQQKRKYRDRNKKDLKQIDNFFESFSLKIRDAKVVYLRNMKNMIRKQERDRFCHFNRIKRQAKKQLQDKLNGQIERQNNEHRIRSDLVRESRDQQQRQVELARRQERVRATRQRKELKEAKRRQLSRIESILREDNERVLMGLQEGGHLQQVIRQMYKHL